jgi:hypothetical protein
MGEQRTVEEGLAESQEQRLWPAKPLLDVTRFHRAASAQPDLQQLEDEGRQSTDFARDASAGTVSQKEPLTVRRF